jgi:hypothetical protein
VSATILLQLLVLATPLDLMNKPRLWLVPFNGLVSAVMGVHRSDRGPDRMIRTGPPSSSTAGEVHRTPRAWHRAQLGVYFVLIEDQLRCHPTTLSSSAATARSSWRRTRLRRARVLTIAGQSRTANNEPIPAQLTVELPGEIRPLDKELNTMAVRRQVRDVAERLEDELGAEQPHFVEGCQRDWDQLPRPDPPLNVGLDGGYVPARHPQFRTEGSFEVIAGKVLKEDGDPTCFPFVPHVDAQAKRGLFEVLKSQGLQMNQSGSVSDRRRRHRA